MDKERVKKLAGDPKFMGRRGTERVWKLPIKNDWECLILKISNLSSEGLL
jgi:hypothetical protein